MFELAQAGLAGLDMFNLANNSHEWPNPQAAIQEYYKTYPVGSNVATLPMPPGWHNPTQGSGGTLPAMPGTNTAQDGSGAVTPLNPYPVGGGPSGIGAGLQQVLQDTFTYITDYFRMHIVNDILIVCFIILVFVIVTGADTSTIIKTAVNAGKAVVAA